jgi:hypothetical protein
MQGLLEILAGFVLIAWAVASCAATWGRDR